MARLMRRPWWLEAEEPFSAWEGRLARQAGWPRGWSGQTRAGDWSPALDMFDTGDRLVLRVELPGVPLEDIDISLEKGVLTIRGQRPADDEEEGKEWLCCERPSGSFYRAIQLPGEIDPDQVTAEHKDGILTIFLPKRAEKQPQKIAVKMG